MKDHIEGTNMPKITTYRTFDSTPVLLHRGTSQRITPVPIAEVAPTLKLITNDQSSSPAISNEKLAVDIEQQTIQNGLRKIESSRMPITSIEFNQIRYNISND
jgi:hypothetical protein